MRLKCFKWLYNTTCNWFIAKPRWMRQKYSKRCCVYRGLCYCVCVCVCGLSKRFHIHNPQATDNIFRLTVQVTTPYWICIRKSYIAIGTNVKPSLWKCSFLSTLFWRNCFKTNCSKKNCWEKKARTLFKKILITTIRKFYLSFIYMQFNKIRLNVEQLWNE